jgi:hypothetical protein
VTALLSAPNVPVATIFIWPISYSPMPEGFC